jgi:pyrroline-5-carboxylate reductase
LACLEAEIGLTTTGLLIMALEGVEDGAVEAGLPWASARAFARQAVLGTAALLESGAESPADLKDRVASPGGTTIAGLAVLEDEGVRGAVIKAAQVAALGAQEGRES